MPTEIIIGGKKAILPGVYSSIKSGIKNPALRNSYGGICIIDTGAGAGFIGGSGIAGALKQGVSSVYNFNNLESFRAFCRGGLYYQLAQNLFSPSGGLNPLIKGASSVQIIKAAATTQATLDLTLSGTTLTLKTKDEGTVANGVASSGILTKGFAVKLFTNTLTSKYYLTFYVGTYRGIDPLTSLPYNGLTDVQSPAEVLFNSGEFTTVAELLTWANGSGIFSGMFTISALTAGTTTITTNEANAITGYQLFAGATETYSSTHYDTVLAQIADLDNTFFLAPDSGTSDQSTYNTKLLYHIINDARFEKFMVVGAGSGNSDFRGVSTGSVETAVLYDSDRVIVVHGGYQEQVPWISGLINRTSLYAASLVLGRICGLEPQTPITFKSFSAIKGLTHNMSKAEKELALQKGVLCLINDPEIGFCVLQGVNSLQKNTYLVNENATSFDIAVKRITAQLNKEIIINAKLAFFGNETGLNRSTASQADVATWLTGFLQSKMATTTQDNLIIKYQNIQVQIDQDNYYVSYEFVPNFPINKIVFTGTIINN